MLDEWLRKLLSAGITLEKFKALLEKYSFSTLLYIPLLLLYNTGMMIGEVL